GPRVAEPSYGLGLSNTWSDEQRRLGGVERLFDPGTRRYLDIIGVSTGMRCLEVGGGGGSVARWMAERIGSSGTVVVTDLDVSGVRAERVPRGVQGAVRCQCWDGDGIGVGPRVRSRLTASSREGWPRPGRQRGLYSADSRWFAPVRVSLSFVAPAATCLGRR